MGQTRTMDEQLARKLMHTAVATRSSDIERALGLFAALKDTKFHYQDYAWQQYAICLQETRQYDRAESELQKLVKQYTDRTIFRAYNLRHLAEVVIAQGRVDEVQRWVDEAIEIFEVNRDFFNLGLVIQLKASVTAKQGDFAKALEKIEDGRSMVEIYGGITSFEGVPRPAQMPALAGMPA